MFGYVRNDGGPATFIAQRGMPEGRTVEFEDLLLVFSKKSLFDKVEPGFVLWLKDNVFQDERWGFYNAGGTPYVFSIERDVELHTVSVVKEPMSETPLEEVSVTISVVDAPADRKPAKKKRAPARKPKATKIRKESAEPIRKEAASITKPKVDARGAGRKMRRDGNSLKGVKITPAMIIEANYEEASALIDKCNERPVLKKALALSKHFSGKEAHMRHLIKRVEAVNP